MWRYGVGNDPRVPRVAVRDTDDVAERFGGAPTGAAEERRMEE